MPKFIKTLFVYYLSLAIGLFISFGCGSSSSSGSAISGGDTVDLTGIVNAPSVVTDIATPLKGMSKAVTDAAANGVTCHFCTFEGEDLGSCVTDASGTCSVAADLATLKGASDTGTEWSKEIIADCDNGMLTLSIASIVEGTTATIDVGTMNTDTTFATQGVGIAGFDGCGPVYTAPDVDMECAFEAQKTLWASAALTGSGLADDNGILKETIEAYMAAGGTPAGAGFENWNDLINACLAGNCAAQWPAIAGVADDNIDDAYDSMIANGYAGAATAFAALEGALASQFGDNGYGMTALTGIAAGVAKTDETLSVCDQIKAGTLNPATIVSPMMSAEDVATFTTTFGGNCMGAMMSMWQDCTANDTCGNFIDKPAAFTGMLEGYGGVCDTLYDGTTFDDDALNGFTMAAGNCTGTTVEEMMDCGKSMQGIVEAAGWNSFKDDSGAYVTNNFIYWVDYFNGIPNYDPDTETDANYLARFEQLGSSMGDDSVFTALETCKANTPQIDWVSTCYEQYTATEGSSPPSGDTLQAVAAPMAGMFLTTGSTCGGTLTLPTTLAFTGTAPNYASTVGILFTWYSGNTCTNVTVPGNSTFMSCFVTGSGEAGSKITITVNPSGITNPLPCTLVLTKQQ